MIVGHEMTHGFDNNGRMFDKKGNLGNWWTESTSEAYLKKAECFVEQYGNYSLAGHHVSTQSV